MILKLLITFFKIGLFSIGGGYAIIPLIQEEVVFAQTWIEQKVFTDIITISQMTPGPLAVNTSTFVGLQVAGIPGALVATVSCVCGGIMIAIFLQDFFKKHQDSQVAFKILSGLKSTSLGLIISAAATILCLTFFGTSNFKAVSLAQLNWIAVGLFIGSFFLIRKYKIGPIPMMTLCGILGLFLYM